MLEEYRNEFITDRLKEIEPLRKNLQTGTLKVLAEMGHRWKGFSRPYGFEYLEKLSIQLELAAKNNQIQTCREILDQIQSHLNEESQKNASSS